MLQGVIMSAKDALEAFHSVGFPYWFLFGCAFIYAIGKEFRILSRLFPSGKMSEREALSMDEETFRRTVMAQLAATAKRLDDSEADRISVHSQLYECEQKHIAMAMETAALRETVEEQAENLEICETRHETAIRQISTISAGYRQVTANLTRLITAMKEGGFDELFERVGIAEMPHDLDALLAGVGRVERGERVQPVRFKRKKA
jgi:hypothetical protein